VKITVRSSSISSGWWTSKSCRGVLAKLRL